jgi:hypothetical protein
MARAVIKQPNGKFAIFSSIVDHFIVFDATEDEIRQFLLEAALDDLREGIEEKLKAAREDWPPFTRGTPGSGRDRWDDAAWKALLVHSPHDEQLREMFRDAGMTEEEVALWERKAAAALRELDETDGASIAPPFD